MEVPPLPQTQQPQSEPHHSKRKPVMWTLVAILLVIAIAVLIWWWFWLRFEESTDDAYVNGNMVVLTPQVPGIVTSISVDDTNYVSKGRIIVELDRTDAEIALGESVSNLAETVREVVSLFEKVDELQAEKEMRKAELIKKGQDFAHRQALVEEGGVSKEDYEHSEADFISAFASVIMVDHQLRAAIAQVENCTVETHPLVEKAKESVRQMWVNLQRCTISAPVDGMVAQKKVQVGEWVNPGDFLLEIIPFGQMWVDANFKETQLRHMRIGQDVELRADLYGRGTIFHGKIVGIPGGTGSVFSVLPPQNATGNWIKIVQRLPVRIALDPKEMQESPLRLGLSMDVTVDTHNIEGLVIAAQKPMEPLLYETDVFEEQESGAEPLIAETIEANLVPLPEEE